MFVPTKDTSGKVRARERSTTSTSLTITANFAFALVGQEIEVVRHTKKAKQSRALDFALYLFNFHLHHIPDHTIKILIQIQKHNH